MKYHLSEFFRRAPWGFSKAIFRIQSHLELQIGARLQLKIKSIPSSIKMLTFFKIDLWMNVGGFWNQNGAKFPSKSHQKTISTSRSDVSEKVKNTLGRSTLLGFRGVEVGKKIGSKINEKLNVFFRFCVRFFQTRESEILCTGAVFWAGFTFVSFFFQQMT